MERAREQEREREEERKGRTKEANTTIARTAEATIVCENALTTKSNANGLLSHLSRSSRRQASSPTSRNTHAYCSHGCLLS